MRKSIQQFSSVFIHNVLEDGLELTHCKRMGHGTSKGNITNDKKNYSYPTILSKDN